MHSLGIVQWNSTRRDHPGNLGGVSGSGPVTNSPKYFITFIDDYSRYMYLYLLRSKDEGLDAFKVFKAEVENQCGKHIKIVRLDRGGEYYGKYTENGQAPGAFAKFL